MKIDQLLNKIALISLTALAMASVSAVYAQQADHPSDKTLIVGTDFGVAPWVVRGVNGPEGFGVDMINEITKRLKRPSVEIVDVNFSALFAALFSKRIEFTVNPLNITAERAERMIFSQPIMSTGNGFLVKASNDMKGFRISRARLLPSIAEHFQTRGLLPMRQPMVLKFNGTIPFQTACRRF